MMTYYMVEQGLMRRLAQPPIAMRPLASNGQSLLPPTISALHGRFREWGELGFSPGPLRADHTWIDADGGLLFAFSGGRAPRPLLQVGAAPDLAAWLVLLDKWMETFVVIARARAVWSVGELAGALTFLSPAFLPPALVQQPPDNWARVAQALAEAVADGPFVGASQDRHWRAA